jgi:hypothetical protein
VATYSTILGLKLNSESDPFQLSDFIQNWELLDASPGVFICTSTSRPNWSSSQAGRMIFMTDLKQLSYWSGTTWTDLRNAAPVFAGGTYINKLVNPGSSPTFNILTFTTPRPCAMAIWLSATYNWPNNQTQDGYQVVVFDGVAGFMGGFREQIRFAGNSGDSSSNTGNNMMSMQVMPSVSAGQHTIGVQPQISSSYKVAVNLVGVKIMAMMAVYASGNVL